MSGFSTSARDGASPLGGFLIFWSRDPSIRQSATAAANIAMSTGSAASTAASICKRRLDPNQLDAGGRRQIDRPGDQHRVGAERRGGGGDRIALLARGMVGDVAHRIDRLLRRSGGDQHPPAGQAPVLRLGCEMRLDGGKNIGHLRHPPRPIFAARHRPVIRPAYQHAIAFEPRQIALRRRVVPHPHIHRRRDQHRSCRLPEAPWWPDHWPVRSPSSP